MGHWEPQALSLQANSHAGILSPTDSNCDWNWTDPSRLWHLVVFLFDVHLLPVGVRICNEFNHVKRWRWYSDIFDRMHQFRCSSAYLHRCISWLTAGSWVNMLQSSHSYFSKFHTWDFSSRPSPSSSYSHFTNIAQGQQQRNCKKEITWTTTKIQKEIRRQLCPYVTLAQANHHLNLFLTILCTVGYLDMHASKYNTDASFILPNLIGPSAIHWRIS